MAANPKRTALTAVAPDIAPPIVEVRGQKVILDADLARIYGTATKYLNRSVKRNALRFPPDFLFRLTPEEAASLRFHSGTSKDARGGRRYLPYAFTEHGAIMAATVLNSPRAVQMSVFVVRAFVKMRAALTDTRELARKLAAVEAELKSRLDVHEAAIVEVLQRIMKILDPPPPPPEPTPPEIGFHVKEDAVPYRIKRKPVRLEKTTRANLRGLGYGG
jgi:phage regulator Rha-like protein